MSKKTKDHHGGKEKTFGRDNVRKWVREGPNSDLLNRAEIFGKKLKNKGLTTSQIRQVFTRLKAIEAKGYEGERKIEFLMLKPYLAYAAGRHSSVRDLKEIINHGIDSVLENDNINESLKFKNFCKLFEAILAYHRAYGGK